MFVVVLVMVSSFGATANANHTWGGYHWARTANPFTVKLGDNMSSLWDPYLTQASIGWSISDVLEAPIVLGLSNLKNCKPVWGRIEVCNNRYGTNGWLGIASIWISGTHITQGTVKLNDSYFNTSKYNTPAWRRLVSCQEIGHTLGLNHQNEDFGNTNLGTCMDYTNDPDGSMLTQLTNEYPNAHDYEELNTMYVHADSITTISQTVLPSSAMIDHTDSSTWGKEISRSSDKHGSLYERDLGNGKKVYTFVTWASE